MGDIFGSMVAKALALLTLIAVTGMLWWWNSSDRVTTMFSTVTMIKNETWPSAKLQPGRYGTGTITAADLIALRALPDSQVSGATLINDWGGTWTVRGMGSQLGIAVDGLSSSDCVRAVTRLPPATGITGVAAASSVSGAQTATHSNGPMTTAAATTACGAARNAVEFVVDPAGL
ncbi:PilS-like protein [Azospirillum brasilense]|nr:PilS-like protein [Azospirillum brasilense]